MAKKPRFTRPEEEVHQRITRSYVFALSLIALTATSAFLSQKLSAAIDERGDRIIMLLDRQAALSQRLALQASQLALSANDDARKDASRRLEGTVQRLGQNYEALRSGGELDGIDVPRSPALQALLLRPDLGVDALFSAVLAQAKAVVPEQGSMGQLPDLAALTTLAEGALFERLNEVAGEFRRHQQRQVALVEIIAALVYLLTLAGLALEARYVFAPIARETTDRTRQFVHARSEVSRLLQEVGEGRRQLEQVRDELRRRALHDELTGLPNRRCLLEFGSRAIANAQRGERVVALLYIELGRLDVVNESLGLAAGDTVLQEAADILTTECRAADFPARAGGDKLLLLVPDLQGSREPERLAERLLERYATPIMVDGQVVRIEVNIGIADSEAVSGDFSQLLAKAEQALHEARQDGAGRWCRFDCGDRSLPAVRDARFDPLRAALAHDTVKTWYIPVLRQDGQVESMDLRMAWLNSHGEMHGTHEVVQIEGYGTLADHLLERSIVAGSRALARWHAAGYRSLRAISVEVTVAQLRRPSFAARLASLLAEFGVEADSLAIEVDDGELAELELADEQALLGTLEAVQEAGVSLTLANVSSAPALFVRLSHLRPDRVKFAASFTAMDGLASSRRRSLEVIARASQEQGFELLAQDVRDPDQASTLETLGCTLQQGPCFAPPMERSLVSAWLRERRGDGPPDREARSQAA